MIRSLVDLHLLDKEEDIKITVIRTGLTVPTSGTYSRLFHKPLLILNLGGAQHLRLLDTSIVMKFHRLQEMAIHVTACHMEGHKPFHQVMEMCRTVREGP